jgi:hypothetical protein
MSRTLSTFEDLELASNDPPFESEQAWRESVVYWYSI